MESIESNNRGFFSATMADSRHLRLFTIFLLYIGQGIPIGLFYFSVPAWMAANGAAAKDIAFVVAMMGIPWSFKFFAGLIIDRYTLLAMGRRRVWIIGAQFIMIASLLLFAIIDPEPADVLILGIVALVVNTAVVFQDVAVDGLAVDLLAEDERSMGGAFASGGQVLGIAASAALTGKMIHAYGASAAYLACTGLVSLVTLYIVWVRERVGEGRMPWSKGEAQKENMYSQAHGLVPMLKILLRTTFSSQSLAFIPVLLASGLTYGICVIAVPLIATEHGGWAEDQLGSVNATAQLIAGIVIISIGGLAVGKIGAQRSLWLIYLIFIALLVTMLWSSDNWENPKIISSLVVGWTLLFYLVFIGIIVIAMRLSPAAISATQFAVFMAISNMGISLAGILVGSISALAKPEAMFMFLIGVQAVAIIILLMAKFPTRQIQVNANNP